VDQAERRLRAVELTCVRGQRRLFENLSFTVAPGELLWVVGTNGSGKTSLLRLLCGLMRPEEGRVLWRGHEVRKSRDQLNTDLLYFGHAPAIKDDLTALENLRFGLVLAGIDARTDRLQSALAQFGLADRSDVMARALSQGQRRRAVLARLALATEKALWILDEPFTALDREAIELVCGHLQTHLSSGASVVLTSHQDIDLGAAPVTRLRLDS
jgi:heme exporter protein A